MDARVISVRQCVLALALTSLPAVVLADDVATDLDKVVVTATRTEQVRSKTLAAVTVIDREQIERLQPSTLLDLLRTTPGLWTANNGGQGKSSSIYLRGTESDHVLVLVDGVRIGSATSGGAALQDIPVDQVERVEIVRGPFSSLYGADAIGGVIQIFTRRPQGSFSPYASVALGSADEYRASAGVAGRSGNGWYALGASHLQTDGINVSACKPASGGGCRPFDPDLDGYRNTALNLQGGYRFNAAWDGEVRLFHAEGRNEYDNSSNDVADVEEHVASARLRYAPSAEVSISLNLGRSADLSRNYLHDVATGNFDTRRTLAALQADIGTTGTGLFTVGVDWQRDHIDSNTAYVLTQRDNHGVFGQWQRQFGAHALQASLRRDDNSQFGGKTTGNLLWGLDLSDALRLTASVGSAYKAPTFNELYYPNYGRPDLQPETARSAELGLRGEHGWGHWSLSAYQNDVEQLIAYDASIFAPSNIDKARIRGAELATGGAWNAWLWTASASWLDPRGAGATSDGKLLPRRARKIAGIDLDRNIGAWSVGASVHAVGARYDDLSNTRRMGGYALTDLRIGYALSAAWDVRLSLNNVFDRQYETARWYNQPGRNFLLTLNYRPSR